MLALTRPMEDTMTTSIKVTDRQIFEMVRMKLREVSALTRGTYNHADPTAFEKGEAWVYDDRCGPEDARKMHVSFMDCTWGVDIRVTWHSWDREKHPRVKIDCYLPMDESNIARSPKEADLERLLILLMEWQWTKKEPKLPEHVDDYVYFE